jgi:regulator of cell morphogenesis and NO signaling
MIQELQHATVGEIAAADFRAAEVFERFGIDFCCGGRRSVAKACRDASADPAVVMRELAALPETAAGDDEDAGHWPLDRLTDHIVGRHHTYVRRALPTISSYLAKLETVHGARHPELATVRSTFEDLSWDLLLHLYKEEQVLFPYIRDLVTGAARPGTPLVNPFGTVRNPICMMEREHQVAADGLRAIRELTDGFATPRDGCETYAACMAHLADFERDLHRHVHLENNVLFPRAVALEQGIVGRL